MSRLPSARARTVLGVLLGACVWIPAAQGQGVPNISPSSLDLYNVTAETLQYRGRAAVRIVDAGAPDLGDGGRLAIVRGTSFTDGAIEVELSGNTAPNAPAFMRGFVGIAFRVAAGGAHFECFYLRPKNGRSPDPVQRSHSTQYISIPGYTWDQLRSEAPGRYESYVDLVAGEWTSVRIVVSGDTARLYVSGAAQPALVVNDLKQPKAAGGIALWVGPGTIAYFANLKIAPR